MDCLIGNGGPQEPVRGARDIGCPGVTVDKNTVSRSSNK